MDVTNLGYLWLRDLWSCQKDIETSSNTIFHE